jgi:hypothetical protein
VRNERKAEVAALTRDELVAILTEIVQATRARLSEARPGDGLKAAEMLTKMCGWMSQSGSMSKVSRLR